MVGRKKSGEKYLEGKAKQTKKNMHYSHANVAYLLKRGASFFALSRETEHALLPLALDRLLLLTVTRALFLE